MQDQINNLVLQHAWLGALILGFLCVHTGLKAWRDATDKTPETDDNWFERTVTIMGKIAKYLGGIRAK